jgi:hypothetical protein
LTTVGFAFARFLEWGPTPGIDEPVRNLLTISTLHAMSVAVLVQISD